MTTLITRDELKAAIDNGSATILDALAGEYWEKQHLPGAIPMHADHVEQVHGEALPDRAALIVTYCSNAACSNSQAVATKLERLGYTNVRKYRDGIEDWAAAGLPLETGTLGE
ncbi:rhodanese-like domain-containing protein [Catenulispora sp. NF23]|uniref:Rhodanese-like domain-containing protein n=1 Tax=Catenulispora pinistramenti TaxID=2705254 RepID=A0ABS5KIV1_9ACTN|nr:rhodanese-like domain-containing protein [Catenulispora pinistramenti]MBS2532580.1 rhodanese-like domain-containing protein [Catenulispora pinistramenti]MBS2546312.1 rhodanese-like domain-containing protein [Catenulispora pinistramenti]